MTIGVRLAVSTFALVASACVTTSAPGTDRVPPARGVEPAFYVTRVGPKQPTTAELQKAIRHGYDVARGHSEGKNADYIPELAKVNPNLFGIVIMRANGEMVEMGDTQAPFTIQSISKVFTLARALKDSGPDLVLKKIGADATGQPFNSIVALGLNQLQKRPTPGNPLVNAGAIATVSLVAGDNATERWKNIAGIMNAFAGRVLTVDDAVYKSETATNQRNQSIAWLLKADETMKGDPPEILDLYTRQCSLSITARDLASMGATLANGGINPRTNARVVDPQLAAEVLAVMSTAGLYETTGQWMFKVGAPAKSGVGGGVVAVVPGRYTVAAFSPPLDEAGNSVKAQRAIETIIKDLEGNVFYTPQPAAQTAQNETQGSP
jgi:glutaminase